MFDAGLRRARTAQARAAFEGSVATYRQTVLISVPEVEDNLAALSVTFSDDQIARLNAATAVDVVFPYDMLLPELYKAMFGPSVIERRR